MGIEIRKATPDEFGKIHQLIMEFAQFIRTPEKVRITPEQMVEDQAIFNCLIALDGTHIIGFATFFFSYYSWSGKAIYLDDLYVKPAYRCKGIGGNLFDTVIELGKQESCRSMRWQVSNWNDKAQAFYKSRGALIDDTEVNCVLGL